VLRVLLGIVLLLLLAATPATAATRTEILQDCEDGSLSGTYTPSELRDARNNIPADVDQYSDCRDVLARALTGGGSSGGGSGGGGGGTGTAAGGGGGGTGGTVTGGSAGLGGGEAGGTATGGGAPAAPLTPSGPDEQGALDDAARSAGSAPIAPGEQPVVPGATGFAAGAARNELPPTLVVTLVLLALAAVAATVPAVRRRVHRHRPA
jgi:hypothetical protein